MLTVLLTGCGNKDQQAQQQGVLLRGQYQAMAGWQGTFQVCAQLGEQVYEFTLEGSGQREGEEDDRTVMVIRLDVRPREEG